MVNISAKFSKDDREFDGLSPISGDLVEHPLTRRVVVGVIETIRITTDVANGSVQTPTIRFVQVEVMDGDDASHVRELLNKSFRRRTGRNEEPHPTLFDDDGDEDGNVRVHDDVAADDPDAE